MLSVISLPFLCAWGLPISLLTIVGNLIFGPFLALFLVISSVLFFAQLLGWSAAPVGVVLNSVCAVWLKLLSLGSTVVLVCVSEKMFTLTLLCALVTVITFHHKRWGRLKEHLIILCTIVVFLMLGSLWYQHAFMSHTLYNRKKTVVINKKDGVLKIEDYGGLTEKRNTGSFIQFSLIPAICKKAGSLTIDRVVLHKLTPRAVDGVRQLAKTVRIKTIIYAPVKKTKTDYTPLLAQLETVAPVTVEEVQKTKKKGTFTTP